MTITRYAIRRVSADGTSTTHELVDCGEEFELHVYDGDEGPVVTKLGELPGGFTELLLTSPELVTVGTGFTDISTDGSIDIHTLLGLLVVEDPSAEEPDVDDWLDDDGECTIPGVDAEALAYGSEQIHRIRTLHHELIARWILIDGRRAFVLRGEQFAAVGLADEANEWDRPAMTRPLLDWSYYQESGGPCTFDGGAELGWCGAGLWAFHRWGDYEPDAWVMAAPSPLGAPGNLASIIEQLGWIRAFLISAIGFPALPTEDRHALNGLRDVEGTTVTSHLSDDLNRDVVVSLIAQKPVMEHPVAALMDPSSEYGALTYAWVNQLVHGLHPSASWGAIHAAMFGQIEMPADEDASRSGSTS